jgi:hypothetical protein
MEDALSQFALQLIEEKQLTGVSDSIKEQIADDIKSQLMLYVFRDLISELTPELKEKLNEDLNDDDMTPELVRQFLDNSGVDTTAIVLKTMTDFSEYYLEKIMA